MQHGEIIIQEPQTHYVRNYVILLNPHLHQSPAVPLLLGIDLIKIYYYYHAF